MLERSDQDRFRRQVVAMIGRADDPEAFAYVVKLLDAARIQLNYRADQLRREDGYSWADLARPLGTTRGAAQQRFRLARPGVANRMTGV